MQIPHAHRLTAEEKIDRLNSVVSALVVLAGALAATHSNRAQLKSLLTTSGGRPLIDPSNLVVPGDARTFEHARKSLERLLSVGG